MIKYTGNHPETLRIESKSDPCRGCMNGPQPGWYCSGCSNFAYACKLHDIDQATLDKRKPITPAAVGTHASSVYTEEQKSAVNQHLEFFNKIVKGQIEHNISLGSAEEAFLKCIFEHILQCMKNQNTIKK